MKMLGCDTKVGVSSLNTNSISIDVISRIEKDLEPYDVVSMVFLLYDVPEVALKRLLVYESLSKDDEDWDLSILKDWALQAQQQQPTWRDEFLEALAICQLYRVIRDLGIPVEVVKKCFVPDYLQISIYVDPMKKLLFKLCENMTTDNLEKLQSYLRRYNYDTIEYEYCEMIFLELILKNFITIKIDKNVKVSNLYQTENLAKIVERLPGLVKFAKGMRQLENNYHSESASTSDTSRTKSTTADEPKEDSDDKYVENVFNDICKQMFGLAIKDKVLSSPQNNTAHSKKLPPDAYCIKNPKRVGVCYIINQETFKDCTYMEGISGNNELGERLGSNKDKIVLEKTMASLNFEVITHRNLDHKKIMEFIKNIVQFRVQYDDSMFMLCILSHGVKDHVYAADSVKVKVEDIQNLLDDEFQERQLYDIPKIMIIQACQVDNNVPHPTLVADSPSKYYMRKSHFLTYWATAPELEAYRDEKRGSIFIQILCFIVQKYANKDHLQDIFTMVNAAVTRICTKLQRDQVPLFKSTLMKKLYLQIPDVL